MDLNFQEMELFLFFNGFLKFKFLLTVIIFYYRAPINKNFSLVIFRNADKRRCRMMKSAAHDGSSSESLTKKIFLLYLLHSHFRHIP